MTRYELHRTEPKVPFHALVTPELLGKIKQTGIRYARIVELGYNYLQERTELHKELMELREGNEKMQKRLTFMHQKIAELENNNKESV